jgi:hypothetical protein
VLARLDSVNLLAIYDAIMLLFSIFVMGVHGAVFLAMLGLLSGRALVGTWFLIRSSGKHAHA